MKTYLIPTVGPVAEGFPFELNDVKYPANWLALAAEEDLTALGITVEEIVDTPEPTLKDRKEELLAAAWSECETRLESASVSVDFGGTEFPFGLDRDTRENISGIVNAINAERSGLLPAGTVPNPRPFAPKGHPLMAFSHEALATVGAAVMSGKDNHMAAYFVHKGAISDATELAQLDGYDVTTGWPAS